MAVHEDSQDGMLYFRLWSLIDRYYEDSALKLKHYTLYMHRFGVELPFFSETAKKRISELKEQIHYGREVTD